MKIQNKKSNPGKGWQKEYEQCFMHYVHKDKFWLKPKQCYAAMAKLEVFLQEIIIL